MADYPARLTQTDFTHPDDPTGAARTFAKVKRSLFSRQERTVMDTPRVSIETLELKSETTGKHSSWSFARNEVHAPIAPADKTKRWHFAPVEESVQIKWKIKGHKYATHLRFEVFTRNDDAPLWTKDVKFPEGKCPERGAVSFDAYNLDPQKYPDAEIVDRHDAVRWPGGCPALDLSPYMLKLTLVCNPGTPSRCLYFDVLFDHVEFEWGPESSLPVSPTIAIPPVERDLSVYRSLTDADGSGLAGLGGNFPKPNEFKKVLLFCDRFAVDPDEYHDNSGYETHRASWGDGPNIPVFAKPFVLKSDNKPVFSPLALGNTEFVWDYTDATHTYADNAAARTPGWVAGSGRKETQDFLHETHDYAAEATKPPGFACHAARGGKRGRGAPPVFPNQADPGSAAQDREFPFGVSSGVFPLRPWAAVSKCGIGGKHAGYTGVLFSPSRIGGDAYKLHVYPRLGDFDFDVPALSPLPDVPTSLCTTSGVFEVWREVRINDYRRKPDTTDKRVDWQLVKSTMASAFVQLRLAWDEAGAPQTFDRAQYNLTMRSVSSGMAWYFRAALIEGANFDYFNGAPDGGPIPDGASSYFFVWKDFADFVRRFKELALQNGIPAGPAENPDQHINDYVQNARPDKEECEFMKAPFVSGDLLTNGLAYLSSPSVLACKWPRRILRRFVQDYFAPLRSGIYLVQARNLTYDRTQNILGHGVNGVGVPLENHDPNYMMIFLTKVWTTMTVPHEIGHCLFLNHTKSIHKDADPCSFHESGHGTCLMSYTGQDARRFCATCALRLQGWSTWEVNPTSGEVLRDDSNAFLRRTIHPTAALNSLRNAEPPLPPPPAAAIAAAGVWCDCHHGGEGPHVHDEEDSPEPPLVVVARAEAESGAVSE